MSPENPGTFTIDFDGRLKVSKPFVPMWLQHQAEPPSFCVPLGWKRETNIPTGHALEAWIVWNVAISSVSWIINPERVMAGIDSDDPRENALRSLMFHIRFDSKDRLCCPGLFSSLAKLTGRVIWVAQEQETFSIWSDFAFQSSYAPTREN